MKIITTILLTFLVLVATQCQEPDTLVFPHYTIEYGDSLKVALQEKDSAIYSITLEKNRVIDSLILETQTLSPLMLADTFDYTIVGLTDSVSVSIEKRGESVKMGLKNGSKIVFYMDY